MRHALSAGLDPAALSGAESPLDAAISARDREVLALVRHAVQKGRVLLAFQPVVRAERPHEVVFHEGLLRVLDPHGRIIPARDFMGAVEQHELGRILDCLALREGLRLLKQHPQLRLSINMSARSVGYARWVDTLRRGLLADQGLGERLVLEISEPSAMQMPELLAGFMRKLQPRGVSFVIDDFGAGAVSLRLLRDFYFDIAKVDGQFIRGISSDADNQVLTGALLAVARQFEMLAIAESVENAADAGRLAQMGFACLQGYHFGAPVTHPPAMAFQSATGALKW
nr:EAL domain-containing protein [Alkalilacustris brevis]